MAERDNQADNEEAKDFFKTLSFYDEDPIDLPFESFFDSDNTELPDLGLLEASVGCGNDAASTVIEGVLDCVIEQGVLPRKVATVHPFSLNNTGGGSSQPAGIRLAKFAVDPASSSSPASSSTTTRPTLKLANFAVDPSHNTSHNNSHNSSPPASSTSTTCWQSSEGSTPTPPPLTQRPQFSPLNSLEASRQLFSPPSTCRSPLLPPLTRAPSPQIAATPPPPPQSQAINVACFGHFERELEYRYSFRSVDYGTHTGYIIFSSLDNVYIKLVVHESSLQGLPREPSIWQSVAVKFINDQHSSWCFLTFRTKSAEGSQHQHMTIQAELPMDLNHFSLLVQRRTNFVLSQSRLNALNNECLNKHRLGEISPSFYHVFKPKSFLRPNINNLGNECIDPNIRAEDRKKTVQWILTELKSHTLRDLPGRASHIENRVYDRFAKQGQVLFRFIHQYYAEIRKEMNTFILQSRKEPQILELLDPQNYQKAGQHSPLGPGNIRLPPGVTIEPHQVKQETAGLNSSSTSNSCVSSSNSNVSIKEEAIAASTTNSFHSNNASYQQYPRSQNQYQQMHLEQNAQNTQLFGENLQFQQMQKEREFQRMEEQRRLQREQQIQKERENQRLAEQRRLVREQQLLKEREMQRIEEQRRLQREREQKLMLEQREREKQLLLQSQQRERERILKEAQAREQERRFMEMKKKQQEDQRRMMMQKQEEQRRALLHQEQLRRHQQEQMRLQRVQEEKQRQQELNRQREQARQQELYQQEIFKQLDFQKRQEQQALLQQQEQLRHQQQQQLQQQMNQSQQFQSRDQVWQTSVQQQQQPNGSDGNQVEIKYSDFIDQQQQQQVHQQQLPQQQQPEQDHLQSNQTVETANETAMQEVKYSKILQQSQSSTSEGNEYPEENPYLRYTQYLSNQNAEEPNSATGDISEEPTGSAEEVKYAHVLQQQESAKRKETEALEQQQKFYQREHHDKQIGEKRPNEVSISFPPNVTIEPVVKPAVTIKQEPQTSTNDDATTTSSSPPSLPASITWSSSSSSLPTSLPSSVPSSSISSLPSSNIKLERLDTDVSSSGKKSQESEKGPSGPSSLSLRPIHTLMGPSKPDPPQRNEISNPQTLMGPTRPQMMMTRPPMMMRPTRPQMMRPSRPQMMRPTRPQMMMMNQDQFMMPMISPPESGFYGRPGLVRGPAPSRLLSPNQFAGGGGGGGGGGMTGSTERPIRPAAPSHRVVRVFICPTCGVKFPMPESDPETQFKTNFSCHVLFNHLRAEVEAEMGCDDLEVCPADDCPYNIVQLREDGVPDAESFLVKHYISRHLDVLLPLLHENPIYCHEACLKTIEMPLSDLRQLTTKTAGLPNPKLKPIFLEKYFKFARNVAKCPVPAECDPIHVVVFLNQWVSRRNYSLAGINTLVGWVSEVHSLIENKPLHLHPRLEEFVNQMETRLTGLAAPDNKPVIDTKRENEFYGDVITDPFDIIKATVCPLCNDKFQHTTKLLYHLLHLHKVNPVHFINKHLRAKPVRCNHCDKPCMSPITFALHADQHLLKTPMTCPTCGKKFSSYMKYYTEDICGDNAIPRNVKLFVNNATSKLKNLEENSDIIGENFSNNFSKYAKRATINELPRDYRKLKKGKPKRKQKTATLTNVYQMYDYIPDTAEEWIINIPSMLDARISVSALDKQLGDARLQEDFDWIYPNGEREAITFENKTPEKRTAPRLECSQCKKYFVTMYDMEQHEAIHRFKASSSFCQPAVVSPRLKKPAKPRSNLTTTLTTLICADCDGCPDECDHSGHGIMLRQDSLADHVARTGHQRCRVARELRPETDCKVNVTSLAYSSVYGNKIRKLWKLLAKNDLLTSTSYEFANANRCKVKDCDFQASTAMEIFRHIRENHLTEIKQLKIKIGKPKSPGPSKKISYRKPGPKSKTKMKLPDKSPSLLNNCGNETTEEVMDFESAINSLSELSKQSEIPDTPEHEMILTQNESSVTLTKMDI